MRHLVQQQLIEAVIVVGEKSSVRHQGLMLHAVVGGMGDRELVIKERVLAEALAEDLEDPRHLFPHHTRVRFVLGH